MESDSGEYLNSAVGLDEKYGGLFFHCEPYISAYVLTYPMSTNTKLFSMLALLNAYVPNSYLIMEECREILGPPDPIYGGPPFEVRMQPFSKLIRVSGSKVRLIHPDIARRCVELLSDLGIPRSSLALNCVFLLCGEEVQPHTVQFVKDLLTMREMGPKGKEKFSLLIKDIVEQEKFIKALLVLRKASNKFRDKHIFPQTVARLYNIGGRHPNFKKAEKWAKEAIKRVQNNSYAADTLGQVYKNHLRWTKGSSEVNKMTVKALEAFKDVEMKADKELDPELSEYDGCANYSVSFNNRGHFGFIQVAKIVSEKHKHDNPFEDTLKLEVEYKFEFFEWYLSYSQPDRITVEPDYFWKDVASCYQQYTAEDAADSTSFPALLDCLNHGLFVSKEKRAFKSEVTEKTRPQLEQTRDELKTAYEEDVDDVKVAERYILSNIILSNKEPHSPQHVLVRELQEILQRFLPTGVNSRDPEFYLLVLLLFWPEEQLQKGQENNDDERFQEPDTDKDQSQDQTIEEADVKDNNTVEEPEQPPPGLVYKLDMEEYVTLMEKAYDKVYDKYLRGRYLLPLFFLGKGSGLSRWIHRSRLDKVVEIRVETQLAKKPRDTNRNKIKRKKINDIWNSGEVWQLPQIQDMLQPIQMETMQQSGGDEKMFLSVGGEIIRKYQCQVHHVHESGTSSPKLFYLGFNIRGPVIFKVEDCSDKHDCKSTKQQQNTA
ncbi:sterile alpha motif domain-containing protein 9-like [Poecilia reticulata]|uniref:sterile alpha motif domain-containing protein 9-like n=1 Tax=Poecilia reticulata TaxID=8081 RepID=UPI0004A34161|nr:PREDICTED: sterile alpha motif domain-containing protein 9-like [Poecilia reticulata]